MPRQRRGTTKNLAKEERRDIGAVVFLIAHAHGDFEVMSIDRKVYASGSSLDQAWWRFYVKAKRVMQKSGKLPQAHPMNTPESTESADDEDAFIDT